jgi:hypothetical protein
MLIFVSTAFNSLQTHLKTVRIEEFGFAMLIATLIKFLTQSWQVNALLFIVLILIIAVNTWSGVRLSKRKGQYSLRVLKEKLIAKCIGYFILIITISLMVIMLFLASLRDGAMIFPEYYLNLLVILTFVMLGIFEIKSVLENLKESNTHVPDFLAKVIGKVEEKVNDIIK